MKVTENGIVFETQRERELFQMSLREVNTGELRPETAQECTNLLDTIIQGLSDVQRTTNVKEGATGKAKGFEIGPANVINTVGFVSLNHKFEGQTTKILLSYMKNLTDLLGLLDDMGFTDLEVGVENDKPLLIFLDKEQRTAFGMAPQREGRK